MPRGRKKNTQESIEEQLEKINEQIQNHQDKINALQGKKKDLFEQQKKVKIDTLYQKIQKSGKSVDEWLAVLDRK